MLDENNNLKPFDCSRGSVDNVFLVKEDTKVVFERGEYKTELEAKAGDVVVTFYEKQFPNKVIVVNNEQWKENLETYEAWEQKQKEEWAEKKSDPCCECCCKGC